jgi:tripartite-type tricarboxylate transporter receptor subunit TctC
VLLPQIQGNKLKALAAAADERTPVLPQVPTLREEGFADTSAENWYGLLAPARTPGPILAKLHAAAVAALNDAGVRQKLIASGAIPAPTSPEEFGALLTSELARWSKIVREKGIRE